MTTSLDSQIRLFIGSNHQNIVALASSVATNSWSAVNSLVDRVGKLEITASITNLINSSQAAGREFSATMQAKFPPEVLEALGGVIVTGMGGFLLNQAAAFAALLSITLLSAQIIAIALLLIGLQIVFPSIWTIALQKIGMLAEIFTGD
jgi:hypothetical protein